MKYRIYRFYDKSLQAYERPVFLNYDEEEIKEALHRDYLISDPAAKARILDKKVDLIGIYDDNNGIINLCEPVPLIDCAIFAPKQEA